MKVFMSIVVFVFILVQLTTPADSASARHRRHNHHHHHQGHRHETSSSVAVAATPPSPSPSSSSTNCSYCSMRQAKREYRLASIKNDILRKLHLRAPPNITGRQLPAIPPLRDLMGEDMVSDSPVSNGYGADDDYHATTMKMMLFPISDPPVGHPGACQFRFSPELSEHAVYRATLGVYVRPAAAAADWTTFLLVYAVLDSSTSSTPVRQMIGRRPIHLRPGSGGSWHQFKITREVRAWLNDPASNHGLIIEATDNRGVPVVVVQTDQSDDEPFKPYLEIQVQEQGSSRSKRTLELDCDEHSAEKRCCRYPLVVDFESFGWDWVIVPRRYSAYYCAGDCPFLYYQQYPASHLVQQQRQRDAGTSPTSTPGGAAGGGPCCSPRRVSAISMLYFDEHMNIVYGRLPGMVVEQCGCS